ncbi:uridine kinase [Arenicella chitinivorans]|uniref:Uridine kinase n=1 Tax=Arenicella chitinivorans TaxID=1329800 RepID=A0A918RRR0_9GAMM|nr:uridine kinase [Arenicella chitinivorans]GHA10605.1 uridine kinase [Arenicella chitinivorans]
MAQSIIAIVGASASGKTLFTQTVYKELSAELGGSPLAVLEEDAYYRDQSHLPIKLREKTNYDHPDAFEHDLLLSHLESLRAGQAIDVPIYDFTQHNRSPNTRRVSPAGVVIVEGILLLTNPQLRDFFDIKAFIDTPLDICLLRRIERDMRERGRSFDSIAEQYEDTVRPMYYEFIEPCKQHADIVVTGGGKNRVAIDMVKHNIRSTLAS